MLSPEERAKPARVRHNTAILLRVKAVNHYKVVLERAPEGYTVSCPTLPGCVTEGDTEAEALENMRIAIEEYLSVLYEDVLKDKEIRDIEVAV